MTNIEKIVQSFGGVAPMARKLGHKFPSTVQQWKEKGRVPSWRWHEIEQAAKENDIYIPEHILRGNWNAG